MSVKYVSCKVPEIGTKMENMNIISKYKDLNNQIENNNEINIFNEKEEKEKDYYNNASKELYFYPFFNMDERYPENTTKYNLIYNTDNIYDFFIHRYSKEVEVKLQINIKNIIQIIYNISQVKIDMYIFFRNPPKVYIKENISKSTKDDFYFKKFEKKLQEYNYYNLYRNIDPNNPYKYFQVKHEKKIDYFKDIKIDKEMDKINVLFEELKILEENINNIKKYLELLYSSKTNDKKDKNVFQRDVSYFSMGDEFLNLYLNDLIIKISFKNNIKTNYFFDSLITNLKFLKVKIKNNNKYQEIRSININEKINYELIMKKGQKIFYECLHKLIPNLQYSIMSLLTIQQINIFNFDYSILEYLSLFNSQIQERASKIIEEMNKKNNYTDKYLDIETFIKDYSFFQNTDIEYDGNNTKSITVTPSKIIYNIPASRISNHFQRRLIKYNDSIIKIHIVDEDYNNFSSYEINISSKLSEFIETVFKDGITLGFCKYNYVGSSNNQLKTLGGWMVNLEGIRILKKEKIIIEHNPNKITDILDKDLEKENESIHATCQLYKNCDEIINKFGDFSKELNVFKNTARKGMIFSDSKYVTDVNINNVIPLEDEVNEKYIITDGIGKISIDLIELSAQKWGITDLNIKPLSAIQIRFMGCKGVLALDPFLQNNTVHLRESQIKFDSDDTALNICSVANYKEAFLNRQFIILLSSLGVKDEIFEKIQNKIIEKYNSLLQNPNKALSNYKKLNYKFNHKLLQFGCILDEFLKKNVNLLNEPLFSQFINIFVYSKLIKLKFNGKLNDNKCVCLMGVIDETNTLDKNEVYIHLLDNFEYSKIDKILNQEVTLYRSPSLYPGDIKILKAVNNPLLSHMVNVIVFSKKGKRPTFNKLSGGDLDGDRYFVSYNDDITNNIIDKDCKSLEDPKYENKNEINIKKKRITIEDSIDCMIKTTSNSIVGTLCDNHMAFADKTKLKAKDPKCIKLCKYFNQEIDSSKTGDFIKFSSLKENNLILEKRPDFLSNGMMKKNKIYESPGILGKLYRKINKDKIFNKFKKNFFKKAIRREYEINLNYITKNCFQYLADSFKIYNDYKIRLCDIMKKYNFCTEAELFFNLRIFKNNRGYRGKSNSYNIELKNLINDTHEKIIQVFKIISIDVASAIYVASYINLRRVYNNKVYFSDDYEENIAKLISIFEIEKFDFKKVFTKYINYANLKQKNKNTNKNKFKRIFSLPWVIKDIRDLLLKL